MVTYNKSINVNDLMRGYYLFTQAVSKLLDLHIIIDRGLKTYSLNNKV